MTQENKFGNYSDWENRAEFKTLVGLTLSKVEKNGDEELVFYVNDGRIFRLFYDHDCCAQCSIEDICGDLSDLEGSSILLAECVESSDPSEEVIASRKAEYEKAKSEFAYVGREFYFWGPTPENDWKAESETWAFYKISTIKGSVTIRWYGQSNGYYSETATFEEVKQK